LASTLAGAAATGADEVAGREPAAALRASAYLKLKPDENEAAAYKQWRSLFRQQVRIICSISKAWISR